MEQTKMDEITTKLAEHFCDNLCKHSCRTDISQEQLDEICADCKMGQFICDILNTYNDLNDFEKSQAALYLGKYQEYKQLEEKGILLKAPLSTNESYDNVDCKLYRHSDEKIQVNFILRKRCIGDGQNAKGSE